MFQHAILRKKNLTPSLLSMTALLCFVNIAQADISDGKYGVNQVFDVQRSPPYPVAGQAFTLSSFDRPYSDVTNLQYDIGTGYIEFFYNENLDPSDLGNPWSAEPAIGPGQVGIKLYDANGLELAIVSDSGKIYGLEEEGFLYISDANDYGTFISNAEGFEYGDSMSYVTSSALIATIAELESYAASEAPISARPGPIFAAAVANTGNTRAAGAATALDAFYDDGNDTNLQAAAETHTTDQELSDAVNQKLPVLTGGTTIAVLNTLSSVSKIINMRGSKNLFPSCQETFSAEKNLWLKPFYSYTKQDDLDGVNGFGSDGYGAVVGIDTTAAKDLLIGGAFSYGHIRTNSNDSRHDVNVDAYSLSLYGSYAISCETELNAQVTGGYNKNESQRVINAGGLTRTATGNYDSTAFSARLSVQHMLEVAPQTILVPSASVDFVDLSNKGYTETGADSIDLTVNKQETKQLIPEIRARLRHNVEGLTLEGTVAAGYETLKEAVAVTASYAGGGDPFTTNWLEPSSFRLRSGVSLHYSPNEDLDLSLAYDREDRSSDLRNQTVSGKVSYCF